jgi:hypothetical protein
MMSFTRRSFIKVAASNAAALVVLPSIAEAIAAEQPITVYKTPTCGCCKLWVDHVRKNGFDPTSHDLPDLTATKDRFRVPNALRSCHTAVIGRYVFEGHVPADLIKKFIDEKSTTFIGLAVSGMPAGSPGMEASGRKDPYEVHAFTHEGKPTVYAKR